MRYELGNVQVHRTKRLPHWNTEHGYYFVTFNLHDAIPRHVRGDCDNALDEHRGEAWMRDPRIAQVVADAITHFDVQRYDLLAWCVMPNHVHAVLALNEGVRIDAVVQGWKSFTAKRANALLGRTGAFWAENYFDRSIRDSRELLTTIEYVMNNPLKAGLRDWSFVRLYAERVPI